MFASARKMSVLRYATSIFLENFSQAQRQIVWPSQSRGYESSEIKFSQQRWRRPRCNDTRPGTFKEEVPRDGCCPSNSNTPSALRTVACRGLTHGSAPRAGTSGELEFSAKTQEREEAGQLSPPPHPHSCWGFSPCWLPMAWIFYCYKLDQNFKKVFREKQRREISHILICIYITCNNIIYLKNIIF